MSHLLKHVNRINSLERKYLICKDASSTRENMADFFAAREKYIGYKIQMMVYYAGETRHVETARGPMDVTDMWLGERIEYESADAHKEAEAAFRAFFEKFGYQPYYWAKDWIKVTVWGDFPRDIADFGEFVEIETKTIKHDRDLDMISISIPANAIDNFD